MSESGIMAEGLTASWRTGFLRAFPVPAFLSMPATGLDISDHGIKFMRFGATRASRRVEDYGELPLPPGTVVSGDIKDRSALAATLRSVGGRGAYAVRVALPESKSYLFQTTTPASAGGDLAPVIEFQLEEHVPLPVAESLFDWELLNKGGGRFDVNVTVFPRRAAEEYAAVLREAGLLPLSFEIEAQAVARAVVPEGDTGTYMILDFGETRTGLSVVSRGLVRFTSSIDVAGKVLTAGIMKHFKVSAEEAVRIKNDHGLSRGSDHREFSDLLLSVLSSLRDEVNRHYLYWHTHEAGGETPARIEKILLIGGNANIRGLVDYLSLSMRANVEIPSVWRNAFSLDEYLPPIEARDALRYATAVGLALRSG